MIPPLMVLAQRQAIYNSIPATGAMLEWGSGGTTVWLMQQMKSSQRLTSVEHHLEWSAKVREACAQYGNYSMRYVPPSLPQELGENATCWEENPSALSDYINQPRLQDYDTFLIDGVARGACMMKVLLEAKSGAKVFLHDANRSWYKWALHSNRIINQGVMDGGMMLNFPERKAADLWFCTLA